MDIQHIGSTAIQQIKAKPIIDIVVGIKSFYDLEDILSLLNSNGIYKQCHNRFSNDLLYVIEDIDNNRTHQIHILRIDSPQWRNYVDFRDYMNAFPEKRKEYENLKIQLANECRNIQTIYTDGKQEYMKNILIEAKLFAENRTKRT